MADAVHDGIVDRVRLGKQGSPDRGQRGDGRSLEDSSVVDDQIRGPCEEPQADGHQGNLSQLALGAGVGRLGGSQRSDVHLLRLFSHVLLVGGDGLDDEPVRVDDEQQRHRVDEHRVDKDVGAAEPALGQVVGSAGSHVALRHVPVPAEHRGQSPDQGERPDAEDTEQSTVVGHRLGRETLHDDIVPVECNHCHGPDGGAAEERSQHGVDFAHERSKVPGLVVTVDDHRGSHCEHHEEVGECQVDHKQVGGRSQGLSRREDVHNHSISNAGHDS